DRGQVPGPALTNALAEQYGIELKTEEGFGTGLRAEIERRHSTRRPPAAVEKVAEETPPEAPVETEPTDANGPGDAALAELEPQLEEHWARLAAADLEERRKSLEERERFLAGRDAAAPATAEVRELPQPDTHGWNLDTLTGLVEERADEFPDRVDEWRYTLFYLRSEARVDGTL